MPIFDYSCKACGYTFDVLQKLGAEPLTDCPECGQPELTKLLSAPAFHLKGKGWKNSDDAPKKMDIRPKFVHTFDQATPHAEHGSDHSHAHSGAHTDEKSGGHTHDHAKPEEPKTGMAKIAHDHVKGHSHSHDHGHSHGHSHAKQDKQKPSGHSHGHGHAHGHKHDH